MAIIFSKLVGKNEPLYGKFEHPIKALIQNESNALEKKKTLLDVLFNVEKSNRYAETVMGQTDFDTFQSVKEGAGAENDSIELAFKKTIEHIPFMKEFTITKEMADDSKMGLGARALSVRTTKPVLSSLRGLWHTLPKRAASLIRRMLTLLRATVNPYSTRRTLTRRKSLRARLRAISISRAAFAPPRRRLKKHSDSSQTKCATTRTRTVRRWNMCPTLSYCLATVPTLNRLSKRLSAPKERRARTTTTSTLSTGIGLSSFCRAGKLPTTGLC